MEVTSFDEEAEDSVVYELESIGPLTNGPDLEPRLAHAIEQIGDAWVLEQHYTQRYPNRLFDLWRYRLTSETTNFRFEVDRHSGGLLPTNYVIHHEDAPDRIVQFYKALRQAFPFVGLAALRAHDFEASLENLLE